MAEYAKPDVLVETEWVSKHADDPNVVVVEVDEDTDAYAKGHIPGSLAWNWRTDLQDPVRRDMLSKSALEELCSRTGISNDTTIVLYGGNNNWFAAYAYWYLKYYGHEDVRLMNGGRKKWELEKRPLTTDVPARPPGTYKAQSPNNDIRAFRDQVQSSIGKAGLIDVRSPAEYSGESLVPPHLKESESAQRPGHIPSARNVPWSTAVKDEDGTFRPADELRKVYEGAGLDAQGETVAYCRIGERSAHTWFVLHELLGFPKVRNYDGSWTEWGSLVGVPIVKGDQPT